MHDQLTNNAHTLATLVKAESVLRVKALRFRTGIRHSCAFARALWARRWSTQFPPYFRVGRGVR